jgi:hypothetical protein
MNGRRNDGRMPALPRRVGRDEQKHPQQVLAHTEGPAVVTLAMSAMRFVGHAAWAPVEQWPNLPGRGIPRERSPTTLWRKLMVFPPPARKSQA